MALIWLYAIPAAIAWAAVGAVLNALPLSTAALVLIVAYSIAFGLPEALGRTQATPLGIRWQVPAAWIRLRSFWQRAAVWGSILGPGFITINPYAGFWLLVLAVASAGDLMLGVVLAAAVGVIHGTARALALLRDVAHSDTADYSQAVLRSTYWRVHDGNLSLMISGVALVSCIYRFG